MHNLYLINWIKCGRIIFKEMRNTFCYVKELLSTFFDHSFLCLCVWVVPENQYRFLWKFKEKKPLLWIINAEQFFSHLLLYCVAVFLSKIPINGSLCYAFSPTKCALCAPQPFRSLNFNSNFCYEFSQRVRLVCPLPSDKHQPILFVRHLSPFFFKRNSKGKSEIIFYTYSNLFHAL